MSGSEHVQTHNNSFFMLLNRQIWYSEVRINMDVFCDLNISLFILFPSGLAGKVQALDELKVKGLVIGPIHVSSADKPEDLNLTEISKEAGNASQFKEVIQAAHKRGELETLLFIKEF